MLLRRSENSRFLTAYGMEDFLLLHNRLRSGREDVLLLHRRLFRNLQPLILRQILLPLEPIFHSLAQ